jgi:AraC-like DNA-binding protein
MGVPPHTLSQLLNVRVGKTFFVFVNTHRVEALKVVLHDPARAARGVLDLAFEVGFGSKSTANSFFKKITGTTPTAFRGQKP